MFSPYLRVLCVSFLVVCLSKGYEAADLISNDPIPVPVVAAAASAAATKELVFSIEHALGGSSYSHRTTVKILTKPDGKQSLVYPEKNAISEAHDVEAFRRLLEERGLYKIKIRCLGGNASMPAILASIPACELQKSGFKEDISIYMDAEKNIIGVSYMSPVVMLSRQCDPSKMAESTNVQTRIKFGDTVTGLSIPLQALGTRPPSIPKEIKLAAGAEDEGHNKPPPQSFLQKYWYIVVMMVLYLMIGGSEPEKKKEGGGGGGGGGKEGGAAVPAKK